MDSTYPVHPLSLVLSLASCFLTPSSMTQVVCTNRQIMHACNHNKILIQYWSQKYSQISHSHQDVPKNIPLMEVFALFYRMECHTIEIFTRVQNFSNRCDIFVFIRSVRDLSDHFDIYSLTHIYYTQLTLFLVIITVYIKVMNNPSQEEFLFKFLHHLHMYLRDWYEDSPINIEISFSEWGQHNFLGFHARDIRRLLHISPTLMLDNLLASQSFEYDDHSSEIFAAMVRLMSLNEEAMMTCLHAPVIRERQEIA